MILEHLIVPGGKEVLKTREGSTAHQKDPEAIWKELQWSKLE
jgi:hypothetical protein